MNIFQYFDLGIMPEQPILGKRQDKRKKKKKTQRILTTLAMYLSLWLGILGQRLLTLQQEGTPISWETFGWDFPLAAFISATAIFPTAFPLVFAKMPKEAEEVGKDGWRLVQLSISFQQGFFWQALLDLLAS